MLKIRSKDLEKVVKHSEREFPLEACGILIGIKDSDVSIVEKVYESRNILESSQRYQIDPTEQLRIFLEADESQLEVIGFYHSHPFYNAQVSSTDISSANYPNHIYLIYSNRDKEFECFLWTGDIFQPEIIEEV